MTQDANNKPLKRIFAVSKREEGDKRKADWIEIGAEWPTSNPGMTRLSQNDAFAPLIATGKFDIITKNIE